MGIGKWNLQAGRDKNHNEARRAFVGVHVTEYITDAQMDGLILRACAGYTFTQFDTYAADFLGDWYDDMTPAMKVTLRANLLPA